MGGLEKKLDGRDALFGKEGVGAGDDPTLSLLEERSEKVSKVEKSEKFGKAEKFLKGEKAEKRVSTRRRCRTDFLPTTRLNRNPFTSLEMRDRAGS